MINEDFPILIVESSEDDILLMKRAFREAGFTNPFHVSRSGRDVVNYLKGEPPYEDRTEHRFPRLLILNLKMPDFGGFDLLTWLQNHQECNVIPRIVFTASDREEDVRRAYQLGANSYIVKPMDYSQLVQTFRLICDYWTMCRMPRLPAKC